MQRIVEYWSRQTFARTAIALLALCLVYLVLAVLFDLPGRTSVRQVYRIAAGIETLDGKYDIAVLGDSNARRGAWHRLFPDRRMGNFGVGAEVVSQIAHRVGETAASRPSVVFVLAGINDLIHGRDPALAANDLVGIIAPLRREGIVVYVNSLVCGVPPKATQARMPVVDCSKVREFNRVARTVSERAGASFIDLTRSLMSGDELRPEFTDDGLHLNETGYRVVRDVWSPYVERSPSPKR